MNFDVNKKRSENPVLSVTDAARRAGMTIGEINILIDEGKLWHTSGFRPENRYVRTSDLDAYLTEQRTATTHTGMHTEADGTVLVAEQFDYGFFA